MTDDFSERIVGLFFERSETAVSEAEAKYGRYCKSVAFRIVGDEGDAEECFNDALLAAWNTIPPQKPERLSSYLAKLTRNAALDRYDRRRAAKRGGGECDAILDEASVFTPVDCDIADNLALRETITRFLRSLPKETRIIFMRRYWYMMSVHEIARSLSCGESRVKSTLSRTRGKLRKFLEKEGYTV